LMNTNATNFRKNLYTYLDSAIDFNQVINVNTKKGNAVVISEEDYNGLIETAYLCSIPDMKKILIDGMNTPISDCFSENEVEW